MDMNMVEDDFSSLAEHVLNRELYEDSSPVYGKNYWLLLLEIIDKQSTISSNECANTETDSGSYICN